MNKEFLKAISTKLYSKIYFEKKITYDKLSKELNRIKLEDNNLWDLIFLDQKCNFWWMIIEKRDEKIERKKRYYDVKASEKWISKEAFEILAKIDWYLWFSVWNSDEIDEFLNNTYSHWWYASFYYLQNRMINSSLWDSTNRKITKKQIDGLFEITYEDYMDSVEKFFVSDLKDILYLITDEKINYLKYKENVNHHFEWATAYTLTDENLFCDEYDKIDMKKVVLYLKKVIKYRLKKWQIKKFCKNSTFSNLYLENPNLNKTKK